MGELAVDEPGQSLAGGTTTVGRLASEQRAGFWTTRRAVLVVLIVASAIRLWALGTLPLMIWSDSQLYLASARELYELGTLTDYSVYRAPGYPVALALTFYVFGSSSAGILIMQHALGCLCAGLLTAIGARYSGPKLGCLAGLLFSLDPLFWIFESWAMTETLAVAALLTALAAVLLLRRRPPLAALLVGLSCGVCYLVRANLQVAIPALGLAWLLQIGSGWRSRVGLGLLVLAGFALPVVPWVYDGARRGISNAGIFDVSLWTGAAHTGVLDPNYPLPPDLRAKAAPYLGRGPLDMGDVWDFGQVLGAATEPRSWPVLGEWARASIWRDWPGYFRASLYALRLQLNIFRWHYPVHKNELWQEFLLRTAAGGSGLTSRLWNPAAQSFVTESFGGPLRRVAKWYAARPDGWPQAPLYIGLLLAAGLALLNKRWALAVALAGPLAIPLLNAVALRIESRYSMPAWAASYLAIALVPALLRELAAGVGRRLRAIWKPRGCAGS